jgi:hypothetical protein
MADYIKQRALAAKVGVSMAMLGLLAGLGIKSQGDAQQPASVRLADATSHSAQVLKGSKPSLVKVENKLQGEYNKLTKELRSLQKTDKANFNKIASGFYGKATADATFLKQGDAAGEYLKIVDAAAKFLPIGGSADNALKLDGLGADAFLQGNGAIVSGSQTVAAVGTAAALLQSTDSTLTIQAGGDGPGVAIVNNTGAPRDIIVVHTGSSAASSTIPANMSERIALALTDQVTIQALPNAATGEVATAIVSTEPGPAGPAGGGQQSYVGQLIIGTP